MATQKTKERPHKVVIGKRIRALRELRGLTQEQAARLTSSLGQSTWAKMERIGQTPNEAAVMKEVAKALGVPGYESLLFAPGDLPPLAHRLLFGADEEDLGPTHPAFEQFLDEYGPDLVDKPAVIAVLRSIPFENVTDGAGNRIEPTVKTYRRLAFALLGDLEGQVTQSR